MLIRTVLLLTIALAACREGEEAAGDPRHDAFVATYVDLRRAVLETGGGEGYEARKAEILKKHGMKESELLQYIERQRRAGTLSSTFEQLEDSLSGR